MALRFVEKLVEAANRPVGFYEVVDRVVRENEQYESRIIDAKGQVAELKAIVSSDKFYRRRVVDSADGLGDVAGVNNDARKGGLSGSVRPTKLEQLLVKAEGIGNGKGG